MKKRWLSMILACLMIISVLGGCKSKNKDNQASKNVAPTTAATKAPTSAPAKASATQAPAKDEKPAFSEIVVEVFDRGTDGGKTDAANNYYTQWIQKKCKDELNLGVTFVKVSRWEETEQLNNLMASGSAPDLCFTYSQDLITNYRDLNGIVNLAPYVDTLLPDLKAFLGEDTAVPGKLLIERQKLSDTGEMFSIPAKRINTAGANTFIRKDWLDKLGLPLPTTTQEFYDALVAFKTKDPGGVGKDKVIPFELTDDVRWRAVNLIESFVDPNLSRKDRWVNTVVDRDFLLKGYSEGVRFLNKMYNEGLIDTQFPLYKDDTTQDNLIKSGVVGAFIHNWDQAYRDTPGLLRDLKANVPDAEIVTIDPFKNSAGKTQKTVYDPAGLNFFVPASSKNVEGALRYINWLSKFENRYYLQIGDEGVTHEMVNGVPKSKPATGDKIMNSAQNIDYTIPINGIDVNDPSKQAQAIAQSYNVDAKYIEDAYANAMRDARTTIVVPGITLTAAGPVTQTLIDKGKTLMCEAITCKPAEFDAKWDAGIKDWLASGAQAVIDERAAKYVE